MGEVMVESNGVEICAESFGREGDPAVLLVMGAKASMLWWDEEFCRRLAGAGIRVIRYDHRDTGKSTCREPGRPDYWLADLAGDAFGVLDAFGTGRAHVVGMSMGGVVGQVMALTRPERVATLTAIATTPIGYEGPDLPMMDEGVLAHHMRAGEVDWADREAAIDFLVESQRILVGSAREFDEEAARRLATREVDRARNIASTVNHAMIGGWDAWGGLLGRIGCPTLVIHGTEDPVLPIGHGRAIAEGVPGARLMELERVGHELHPGDWERIIGAIVEHTG